MTSKNVRDGIGDMEIQQQKMIITNYSALCLLRFARISNAKISYVKFNQKNARIITNSEATRLCEFINTISRQHDRLEILLSKRSQYRKIKNANCHICSHKLPPMSFMSIHVADKILQTKIFDSIVIASPILIICQTSSKVPFYRLMQWSLELCGNYVIDSNNENGFVQTGAPVTNPYTIKTYIKNLNNCRI